MIRSGLSRVVKAVAAVTLCSCLALTLVVSAQGAPVKVLVQTEMGDIVIEVDSAKAPNTAANFLKYVDAGAYDAGQFHRTVTMSNQPTDKVKIEVIQASVGEAGKATLTMPPIALERTSVTGLQHKDGTVSMARGAADSATSSWFVCINDQPSLDFGRTRMRSA
jgi:peptidyl-prolyl cis-trans isomerase A (cyclophilin A)